MYRYWCITNKKKFILAPKHFDAPLINAFDALLIEILLPTASEKISVLVFSVGRQFAGISRFKKKRGNKTVCSQDDLA